MNRTTTLFLVLIVGSSFIFPAAAINYAQASVTTNQSNDNKKDTNLSPIMHMLAMVIPMMSIFNSPEPPAYSSTTFLVPSGTSIQKRGTTNMITSSPSGPTNKMERTPIQTNQRRPNSPANDISQVNPTTPALLCSLTTCTVLYPTSNPQQNTTMTPPTTTPPFNNSNTNTGSPVNNTITPPTPPSASNPNPNSGTPKNNTTSTPSTPSDQQKKEIAVSYPRRYKY